MRHKWSFEPVVSGPESCRTFSYPRLAYGADHWETQRMLIGCLDLALSTAFVLTRAWGRLILSICSSCRRSMSSVRSDTVSLSAFAGDSSARLIL